MIQRWWDRQAGYANARTTHRLRQIRAWSGVWVFVNLFFLFTEPWIVFRIAFAILIMYQLSLFVIASREIKRRKILAGTDKTLQKKE